MYKMEDFDKKQVFVRQQTPGNTQNGNTGLPFGVNNRIVWAVPETHDVYMKQQYRKDGTKNVHES